MDDDLSEDDAVFNCSCGTARASRIAEQPRDFEDEMKQDLQKRNAPY